MTTVLNQLFGKTQGIQRLAGDVEFWHGVERAGWLEKQGVMPYYPDTTFSLTCAVLTALLVAQASFCQTGGAGKLSQPVCPLSHPFTCASSCRLRIPACCVPDGLY